MRTLIAGVLLLSLTGDALAQPDSPPDAKPAVDAVPSAPGLRDLKPSARTLVIKRAKQFLKTPDGRWWDGVGYFDYRQTFKSSVSRVDLKRKTATSGWAFEEKVGETWRIRNSADARAWGLSQDLVEKYGDSLEWFDPASPDRPPLWRCLDGSMQEFIMVDEADRDKLSRHADRHYAEVSSVLGHDVYRVELHVTFAGLPSASPRRIYVHVPDRGRVKNGCLSGRFILWPALDLAVPGLSGEETAKAARYQYIDCQTLAVTPEELVAALADGRAELVEWKAETIGDRDLWVRMLPDLGLPGAPAQPAPAATAADRDRARWEQLVQNMSSTDVRTLLGEPVGVHKRGSGEQWSYPKGGYVITDADGRVLNWSVPRWEQK